MAGHNGLHRSRLVKAVQESHQTRQIERREMVLRLLKREDSQGGHREIGWTEADQIWARVLFRLLSTAFAVPGGHTASAGPPSRLKW